MSVNVKFIDRFFILSLFMTVLLGISSCKKKASCSDGKLNGNEVRTDCGGDCSPCVTCSDGVKNQDETGVDCGGSCPPCASCSDGIQNQGETNVDCGGPCAKCQIIYPATGLFGHNLLGFTADTVSLVQNTWYSARAFYSGEQSLRVVFTNPQMTGYNWYFNFLLGEWLMSNVDNYTQDVKSLNSIGTEDVEFGFLTTGQGIVKMIVYENGGSIPKKTTVFVW